MGKRSDFKREDRDLYRTWDQRAVLPLLPHLPAGAAFIEPCAGKRDLVDQLVKRKLRCRDAFDIKPWRDPTRFGEAAIVRRGNAITYRLPQDQVFPEGQSFFITNPPWRRDLLHAIILNLYWQLPTWLLFDSDWMHTQQASPYLRLCKKIVSVGRVRWIEGTANDGKDNCSWYLFDGTGRQPLLEGRR